MKILAELNDAALDLGDTEQLNTEYVLRKAARALLINEDGLVSIQYLSALNYYKLPGGGVENGESLEEALLREIQEEVGCSCTILDEVGAVIEYRNQEKLIHISYCYLAKVVGPIGEPSFEQGEIDLGHTALWVTPEDAKEKMFSHYSDVYKGKFIVSRDRVFLEEALKKL